MHCICDVATSGKGIIKGNLDEKLPIYEPDPKSKRVDSPENRFVRQ